MLSEYCEFVSKMIPNITVTVTFSFCSKPAKGTRGKAAVKPVSQARVDDSSVSGQDATADSAMISDCQAAAASQEAAVKDVTAGGQDSGGGGHRQGLKRKNASEQAACKKAANKKADTKNIICKKGASEIVVSKTAASKAVASKAVASKTVASKTVASKTAASKTVASKTVTSKTVAGKMPVSKTLAGKTATGKKAASNTADVPSSTKQQAVSENEAASTEPLQQQQTALDENTAGNSANETIPAVTKKPRGAAASRSAKTPASDRRSASASSPVVQQTAGGAEFPDPVDGRTGGAGRSKRRLRSPEKRDEAESPPKKSAPSVSAPVPPVTNLEKVQKYE
jgi:hypothetical protein